MVDVSQELIDFALTEMPLVSAVNKPARFATDRTLYSMT
jgi:hypothetical protein